jgi:hypothetical protein
MFDCNALLCKFSTTRWGTDDLTMPSLAKKKEKKYCISLRETEGPIEAKKLTPWLLPTHHPQASASFPRVRPSLNAQPRKSELTPDAGLALGERASQRNSELAPNARLALGERASEPKELRARSQCWNCSGRASEPKEVRAHSQRWTCSGRASKPMELWTHSQCWTCAGRASKKWGREAATTILPQMHACTLHNVLATTTYYGRNLLYIWL